MSNEASWLYGIDRSDQLCVPIFWNGKKRLSPEPSNMFSYDHVDTFFPLTMDELPTFFREVQILFRKFSTRFRTIRYFTMTLPTYFDLLHALSTMFWLKGLMEAYVIQYSHATYTSSTWKTVVSVCFPPSLCLLAWLLACLFVGLVWLFVCVLVYLFTCLLVVFVAFVVFLLCLLLFFLFFFFFLLVLDMQTVVKKSTSRTIALFSTIYSLLVLPIRVVRWGASERRVPRCCCCVVNEKWCKIMEGCLKVSLLICQVLSLNARISTCFVAQFRSGRDPPVLPGRLYFALAESDEDSLDEVQVLSLNALDDEPERQDWRVFLGAVQERKGSTWHHGCPVILWTSHHPFLVNEPSRHVN